MARFDRPDGHVHDTTRSWWNGSIRALWGRRFEGDAGTWVPFARVTCPGCKTARQHR